jgi:WD40 repeat protein
LALGLCLSAGLHAQSAPQIVWSVPGAHLPNYPYPIRGVAWSPGGTRVAFGSADRWIRVRSASTGALAWELKQQPDRIGGIEHLAYSNDGTQIAVYNTNRPLAYRVHRASDGVFLGSLVITFEPSERVRFAPDAQLTTSTGDTTMSRWRLSNFSVVRVIGVGYNKVTTNWVFSPGGTLQASASEGTITVQRRSDGAVVALITGGNRKGITPMAFSPDGARLAAWARWPNETTLYRASDGAVAMRFPNANRFENVAFLRFSPGGTRLVTTGYDTYAAPDGSTAKRGMIRFWRVADGALRHSFGAGTGTQVTSPVAWSPDFTRFAFGTQEATAVVAVVPAP